MIVIIGAGISGLSLSYFLSLNKIKNLVIDLKASVGRKHRSTCLISNKIFKFFDFLKEEDAIKFFDTANFWYNFEKLFSIKTKNKMYIFDYRKLERKIFENIDKNYSNFLFSEKVLDVNLEKNILITNKRKISFEILVDASGTNSFLANKLKIYSYKQIFNSFEICGNFEKNFEDVNIFFDRRFSKYKFGWFINLNKKGLVGLIDKNLKFQTFENFLKYFKLKKVIYKYSHPILQIKLKKFSSKNFLIIGEAAGLIKPFSLGGITYGIISSHLAKKAILSNNLKLYEKSVKDIYKKSFLIWSLIDKLIKHKFFGSLIKNLKLEKLAKNLDPDFILI